MNITNTCNASSFQSMIQSLEAGGNVNISGQTVDLSSVQKVSCFAS